MEEHILLLDNEYADISDLEDVIKNAIYQIKDRVYRVVDLEEDSAGAIEYLLDLKEKNKMISAIVADEHLYGEIEGSDFLRFCRGHLVYLCTGNLRYLNLNLERLNDFCSIERICGKGAKVNKEFVDFAKDVFKNVKNYMGFVRYFLDCDPLTIMLCGYPSIVNKIGLEDVPIIQKEDGCEYKVLGLLEENGILSPEEVEPALKNHYRLANPNDFKRLKYNPSSKRIKKKKMDRKKFIF